jgi:hypothetical protein
MTPSWFPDVVHHAADATPLLMLLLLLPLLMLLAACRPVFGPPQCLLQPCTPE